MRINIFKKKYFDAIFSVELVAKWYSKVILKVKLYYIKVSTSTQRTGATIVA